MEKFSPKSCHCNNRLVFLISRLRFFRFNLISLNKSSTKSVLNRIFTIFSYLLSRKYIYFGKLNLWKFLICGPQWLEYLGISNCFVFITIPKVQNFNAIYNSNNYATAYPKSNKFCKKWMLCDSITCRIAWLILEFLHHCFFTFYSKMIIYSIRSRTRYETVRCRIWKHFII